MRTHYDILGEEGAKRYNARIRAKYGPKPPVLPKPKKVREPIDWQMWLGALAALVVLLYYGLRMTV